MAEKDYDFEKYLSQDKGKALNGDTTSNTQATCTTSNTTQPFSARLGRRHVTIIQAVSWWQRITQREFIEQMIDHGISKIEKKKLEKIIEEYQDEQSG